MGRILKGWSVSDSLKIVSTIIGVTEGDGEPVEWAEDSASGDVWETVPLALRGV